MGIRTVSLSCVLMIFCVCSTNAAITWEVEHRFPLFEQPADFKAVTDSWPISSDGKFAPVNDFAVRPGFTKWLRDHFQPERTAWDRELQVYRKDKLFSNKHIAIASLTNPPKGQVACKWFVDGSLSGTQACNLPFRFAIHTARDPSRPTEEASARFGISVEITLPSGEVQLEEISEQQVTAEFVAAIGDSFASGEGNPDWPTKFKEKKRANVAWFVDKNQTAHTWIDKGSVWWDEPCHRSLLSWPALYALDRAVRNPHKVVQFVSFACSGAEIYDGFFRAQMDPPGRDYEFQTRNKYSAKRDGGSGYGALKVAAQGDGILSSESRERQQGKYLLKYSQHNALARVMCAETSMSTEIYRSDVVDGVRTGQTYYGPVQLARCKMPDRVPNLLLVSFGGNDIGFGGVVADQMIPKEARRGPFFEVKQFFWNAARSSLAPIDYHSAKSAVDSQLPELYSHVAQSLSALGIKPNTTLLAIYPDPTGTPENRKNCLPFTQEGNAPLSWVLREGIAEKIGFKKTGVPFGLNPDRLAALQTGLVKPLREVQMVQANRQDWRTLDSNSGVRVDNADFGLCAISIACSETSCSTGDRVSHWPKSDSHYTNLPRLTYLHEYDPYDPSRMRGFRLAMDAVLTNSKPEPKGPGAVVYPNWLSGIIHPTLSVHARMAAVLSACAGANCGQQ